MSRPDTTPARELELARLLEQWRIEGERQHTITRVVVGAALRELRDVVAERADHALRAAFARTVPIWFR